MPETNSEQGEQVLTLEEAAAFLRLPASQVADLARDNAVPGQKVNGEWRFLKKALADWLRYGHYYRDLKQYGRRWPFDFFPMEDLLDVMERLGARLAALEERMPRRGSGRAVLKQFGAFRQDDDLEERLADTRAAGAGMIIFDTDIVTLHSYGKTEQLQRRIVAVDESEELAVTLVTRMEILQGRYASILKAANQEELVRAVDRFRRSEELLDSFLLVDVDQEASGQFERLCKGKKSKRLRRGDMLIAAIALAQKALLVTRNVDDYKSVTGLRVENWAD